MIKGLITVETSSTEKSQLVKNEKEQNIQTLLSGITVKLCCARSYTECANKIAELKQNNAMNVARIGSVLSQFKEAYLTEKDSNKIFKELLKNKQVNLKRTQAEKYIKVHKFCVKCISICQSTNMLDRLGIEKVALITTLADKEKQVLLGQVVLEKSLTVKQLQHITLSLNKGLSENLDEAINRATNLPHRALREEILKLRKPSTARKFKLQEQYNNLEQANKLLIDENNNLKEKIKALELQLSELNGIDNQEKKEGKETWQDQ